MYHTHIEPTFYLNQALFQMPDTNKQIPMVNGLPRDHHGVHGYDPRLVPEMNGILLAFGPGKQIWQKLSSYHLSFNVSRIKNTRKYDIITIR